MSLDEKGFELDESENLLFWQKDIKQSVKELGKKCKIKWDRGNFVLADVQEFVIEVFGPGLT